MHKETKMKKILKVLICAVFSDMLFAKANAVTVSINLSKHQMTNVTCVMYPSSERIDNPLKSFKVVSDMRCAASCFAKPDECHSFNIRRIEGEKHMKVCELNGPSATQDPPGNTTEDVDHYARYGDWTPESLECKFDAVGMWYSGKLSVTKSGRTCQRWDAQYPHQHTWNNILHFPEDTLAEASNYCRNPDEMSDGPWCYTTDSNSRWEFCDVKLCSKWF
ncbi:unnamed protein product [Owenia fusiformis]|uniref:Uncharacterized protein n=1 Tax=Owenia fusiformis TaxID=6347 RepID=A0A8J1THT6_OWEFU|nr:unnamed protein product [Owenia fusiformis]